MKVWITKYALTEGIIEKDDAEICANINPQMISVSWTNGLNGRNNFYKGQWFENKEDAILEALRLKRDRIQSLEKQIKKLKNLEF